jgi:hypothetical protein
MLVAPGTFPKYSLDKAPRSHNSHPNPWPGKSKSHKKEGGRIAGDQRRKVHMLLCAPGFGLCSLPEWRSFGRLSILPVNPPNVFVFCQTKKKDTARFVAHSALPPSPILTASHLQINESLAIGPSVKYLSANGHSSSCLLAIAQAERGPCQLVDVLAFCFFVSNLAFLLLTMLLLLLRAPKATRKMLIVIHARPV